MSETIRMDPIGAVTIRYRNWRGEVALRVILPRTILFTSTQWHPQAQWILQAIDLDKGEDRSFAMKDILEWRTQS